ncbi:MAG TPA: MFS transporter [Usitatibacter sp.]|nr:MFS transporter [Usitatibacter sp.]
MLVTALGAAQIVSWGTLFYAIGVLGAPMRADLGASEIFLFGSFTAGLLISAALAPLSGRLVDRMGGRVVLSAGSILGTAAMLVLALATHPAVMALGWAIAGAAMAACLYDPAFATLSQHTGERYRRSVTILTLWGGFASTVFWPLSKVLLDAVGWRETWLIYAGLHLFLCLPIHALIVPRVERRAAPAVAPVPAKGAGAHGPRLRWLTASLALATFVVGVMAVHVIPLLTTAGMTLEQAVLISTLFGPVQVAGRVLEMSVARRVSAVTSGFAPFALMVVALAALIAVDGFGAAAFVFITAYGVGNGVLTIVRGTAPAELFGKEGLGAVLGQLSRATLFARALAPACFSGLFAAGLTRNHALAILVVFVIAGAACYAAAVRGREGEG